MNLAAGGYTVTATDANGCEAIIGGTITDPNGLTATITAQVDETCNADNDGSATVEGAGGTAPYTYAWSDGQTVATAVDLAAGTYTVTITDANSCTAVATAEIDQPTVLVAQTIVSTDETCDGADDGTGTVIATGGISPYTYAWGAGDTPTAASNTGLADGTYTVTITDANLCEATTDVVIGQGVVLAIDPIADITTCAGENVGPILLNSVPGSDEISYAWSGGATIGMADGTSTGTSPNIPVFAATGAATTVTITVTATLGTCTDTETFNVTVTGSSIVFASCPADIIANNDVDKCGANVNWAPPIAMNACTGASDDITVTQTMGPAPGTFFDAEVAAVVIEYTAVDGAGNMEICSFTVEVMDMQLPAFDADIVMPTDVTAECDDIPAAFILTNTDVNDNCTDPVDLTIDFTELSTQGADNTVCGPDGFYNYTITRTWTITDEAGNVTTHIQTLTIVDTTAPIAICQDLTIVLDTEGMQSITPMDVDNGSNDNCAPALALALTLDNMDFDCNDLGENTVTLTVADPCLNTATCTAVVTVEENPIVSCTPEYDAMGSDPCSCKDNSTDLINGQFDEAIQIIATAGDTWNITANTGLFDVTSAAPPAAPTALTATTFTNGLIDGIDNDGDSVIDNPEEEIYYTLVGIHVDALGYNLDVESANFGTTFNFTNTCFYPTVDFANLPSEICLGTNLELELSEANGGTGTTQFFVNGTPLVGNIFAGTDWGLGTHTVTATFDAMDAGAFSTLTTGGVTTIYNAPSLEDAQADPGCISEVSTTIDIVSTPSQVNCNDMINVSIGSDCETVITQDMVLEGTYDCFDDYNVILSFPNGTPLSPANVVNGSHVGMTLTYALTHPLSSNLCWGEILVEDKLAPTIACPDDVTISCTTDVDNLALTGSPLVEDCSAFTVDYYDALTDNGPCAEPYTLEIVRTFVAVDEHGFADSCQQTILVERPDLSEVVFPADIVFSCEQVAQNPNLTVGTPYTLGALANHPDYPSIMDATNITGAALASTGSGEPSIAGLPIQGAGSCMLAVLESDELYDVCGASYEILRTWKVRDMCAPLGPDNPREVIQIIKVLDENGPVITTGGNITVSANEDGIEGLACTASFVIPAAEVSDACSEVVSIETIHPFGTNEANGGAIEGLEIGTYNITYVAEDACGNTSTQTFTVTVVDDISPTPICDEITDISLGASGVAIINAINLDDGSFDNCCLDGFLAARMDADSNGDGQPEDNDFAEIVSFDCDDLGNNPMVVLRVSDCYGNFNQCMVEIQLEDNLAPTKISDVADQNITCDFYNDNLAEDLDLAVTAGENNPEVLNTLYGAPVYADNCDVTVSHSFVVDVNTCGEGTITRNWTAVDASGNIGFSCTQIINVNHVNNWEIQFPADVDLVCTEGMNPDETGDFGSPEVFFDDCELIAISVENETFNVLPDACYKIIRTYTAINWCAYDDTNNNDDIDLGNNRYRDVNDGIVVHSQIIKINDDVNPVITCPTVPAYELDENCIAEVTLPQLTDIEDCSPTTDVSVTSTLGTGFGPFNNITAGTYTVTYTVTDNCGNSTTCATSFNVVDNKAPTPYCVGSLIIELMPVDTDGDGVNDNGMAETWATDFDAGSFDNCTAQDDLTFLLSLTPEIGDAAADGSLELTCANTGGQPVYLFVTDEAGNTDLCQTSILVESVENVCPDIIDEDDPVIAGVLATEYDVVLENANVSLNTGTETAVTDDAGAYSLTAALGTDVTVIPEHDVYDNTSVTTIDLVIIRQHILTTTLLDSPYKMIAADVNGNGSITAVDMVMARQVILGMATSYPNNTAWVFVDAAHEFAADWELSDGYPAVVNMNNIIESHDNVDFVAVRVGDVNGTFGLAADADERSGFIIETKDAKLEKGEQITVEFSTIQEAKGYQFTLNHDKLKVVSIDGAGENFGIFSDAITTSFERDVTGKLFAVTFEALENVQLSEALTLDSRITVAEAYNNRGEVMNITLEFASENSDFALYQNVPNPFKQSTTIGFDLPNSTNVILTVSDVNGKILLIKKGDYDAGYNTLHLDELTATGVLYVRLETAEHTANIKMIKVE